MLPANPRVRGEPRHSVRCASADTAEAVAKLAQEKNCPVVAQADSVEAMAELTEKIKGAGVEDIVLALNDQDMRNRLQGLSEMRSVALKKNFRPLGYPTLSCVLEGTPEQQSAKAISLLCKYSSIVVVETVEPYAVLPILTAIMNVFTDPQKPVQVEALRIEYPLAEADADCLLCIGPGGNFSSKTTMLLPKGKQGRLWSTLNTGRPGSQMAVGSFYPTVWIGNERRGFLWWRRGTVPQIADRLARRRSCRARGCSAEGFDQAVEDLEL